MRKIKDERLIIQNLKNIRTAFLIQSIGILGILIYEGISNGYHAAINNPLWVVFIISIIVLNFLNIRVSVDVYDDQEQPKKPGPYYKTIIWTTLIGLVFGLILYVTGEGVKVSLIVGGVVFLCSSIPFMFALYYRKKRFHENYD